MSDAAQQAARKVLNTTNPELGNRYQFTQAAWRENNPGNTGTFIELYAEFFTPGAPGTIGGIAFAPPLETEYPEEFFPSIQFYAKDPGVIPGTDYVPIGPAVSIKNQIGWTTYQSLLILGPLMSPGIVPNNIYAVAIFDGAFASDQGMLNTPAIIEFPVF